MNITLPKKDLLRLLARCQGIATRKSTMPMLSNVLLTARDNVVTIAATDMFLSVTDSAPAEVTRSGAVALPARDLATRIAAMPDGPVQLVVDDTKCVVKAVGTPRKFTLVALPATEFPEMPAPVDDAPSLVLPGEDLAHLVALTRYSIAADETRPHVNSMLLELGDGTLRAVSTDGHRLSCCVVKRDADLTASMLVPLKGVNELAKLLDAESVTLQPSKDRLFITVGTVRLGVKLVDAQFPPYQQVIPKSATRTITVGRKALADAVGAVKLAASENRGVRLTFIDGKIRVTAESPDAGNAHDEVPAEVSGPALLHRPHELTIGLNASYLIETLDALDSDDVLLGVSGELDPICVRPGGETMGLDYVAVIMPMKV